MVRNKEILRSENRDELEFMRREVSGQHHVVCFGSYVLGIKYVVEMKCNNVYPSNYVKTNSATANYSIH